MKTMKRVAALMLALCMLIALPMAVGAESKPLTITAVAPNNWDVNNKENTKIKFTFSEEVNSGSDTLEDISAKVFAAVGIYADANGEEFFRYTWDEATGTCTKVASSDYTEMTGTTEWPLGNFHRRKQGNKELMGNLPTGWTINKVVAVYEKVLEVYPNARLVGKLNDNSGDEDGYVDGIFASADPSKKLSTIDCTSSLDWAERTILNSVKRVSTYGDGLVMEFTRPLPNTNAGLTTTLGLYKNGAALADGTTWPVDMTKAEFYGDGKKALYVPFDQMDAVKTALAANAGYGIGMMMASTQTNELGKENMISGLWGDNFTCNAMDGNYKAIYRNVTLTLDIVDAKTIGDSQVLFFFNQPVEFSNAHYVAVNILNSSGGIARWRNVDGQYQLAAGTKVGEDGWQLAQWQIKDLTNFGTSGSVLQGTCTESLALIQQISKGVAGVEGQDISIFTLSVRIQENANQGESENGLVDTIWAANNESNKLLGKKEDGQTQTWHAITGSISGQAMIGSAIYDTVTAALAAAKAGDSVLLLNDATADMVKVPAGVTLDLNGHKLTSDIVVAFGEVADCTDGSGKLVISKDGAQGAIHLQADNAAMPLYDTNGYRFFSYTEGKLGIKTVTDAKEKVVGVKFGIRFTFTNAVAYDLMANADNADQVVVKLEAVKGGKTQKFNYYLNSNTLQEYADAVENGTYKNPAITLTVSGISDLSSISGTPGFVSPTEMVYVGQIGTYTAQ